LFFLEKRYLSLRSEKHQELYSEYINILHKKGKPSLFKGPDGEFEGTIKSVNKKGLLIVNTEFGDKEFKHKEISLLN